MHTFANTVQKAAATALIWSALAGALFPAAVQAQYYATPLQPHIDEYTVVTRLVTAQQLKEALVKADAYLADKPKDPQMRFIKGVVLTEMGQTADAMSLFTTLTQDYPNNLAVLYAAQNQFEQARVSLEMAIRTNPSYATAHENLGDVYIQLASQSYTKAMKLEPNKTSVQPKLALIGTLFSAKPKGDK
jgi:tetratricopeptide (TPR) repeat protein